MTPLRPVCGKPSFRAGRVLLASAALLSSPALLPASAAGPDFSGLEDIRPIARRYCLACHSSAARSGGIDLEELLLRDPQAAPEKWKTALDVLRAGEMPPPGAERPAQRERKALIAGIDRWLRANRPGGQAPAYRVARRMTRGEYTHTIRDLLELPADPFILPEQFAKDKAYFQPASGIMARRVEVDHEQTSNNPPLTRYPGIATLPADSRAEHGFANRSDQVSLSPALLEKYFAVARDLLFHADFPSGHPLFQAPGAGLSAPEAARRRLAAFLPGAFRRPAGKGEVERYLNLYRRSRREGNDFATAARHMILGVLSSPHFLMRVEKNSPSGAPDAYDLAARLSYFLWTSMPDEALFAAAGEGNLHELEQLEKQARRMLRDPKSKALAEHFGGPWMRLGQVAAVIPDLDAFPSYYEPAGPARRRTVGLHMMLEALLLFETVLVENRSILDFIDADFTYLNENLAAFYGLRHLYPALPKTAGRLAGRRTWFRARLDDRRRGGVLTLGSTLTLTSLPERSSPIVRGAWIADVVFNRPPPPPPPGITPLAETDRSGLRSLSLREQVARHSQDPACISCHERIDPFGFALERYNAVGLWREYDSGLPIDASGKLRGGAAFNGPVGLKDALLERPELFARGFVEQLLAYALGRGLTAFDDPTVSDILDEVRGGGYRLRDIVVALVKSPAFRQTHSNRGVLR